MDTEIILNDPARSAWLRDALRAALDRNPAAAAQDAIVLAGVLCERFISAPTSGWPGATPAREPAPIDYPDNA